MRRLFGTSKRQRLIYIMLCIWVFFGVMGFKYDADFAKLAVYYGAFATNAMMYIWSDTKRPHEEGA